MSRLGLLCPNTCSLHAWKSFAVCRTGDFRSFCFWEPVPIEIGGVELRIAYITVQRTGGSYMLAAYGLSKCARAAKPDPEPCMHHVSLCPVTPPVDCERVQQVLQSPQRGVTGNRRGLLLLLVIVDGGLVVWHQSPLAPDAVSHVSGPLPLLQGLGGPWGKALQLRALVGQ